MSLESVADVSAPTLSATLRESTTEAHQRAERHPHQVALMRGPMDLTAYTALVSEMHAVYRALAPGVAALAAQPRFAAWAAHFIDRDPVFAADLAALGQATPVASTTAEAKALAERIASQVKAGQWFAIVGEMYVLEGSTNGGMFISKAVEKRLNLTPGNGTAWLNPHGPTVRDRWAVARTLLDALTPTHSESTQAITGANAMFTTIERVSEELSARA